MNAQGDQELIFSGASGQSLRVLKISYPIDDVAWATSASGTLYATDSGADTVDAITGSFTPGTAYTAVAPCNAHSAPSVCPAPGYPASSQGTINLQTGAVGNIVVIGPVSPKGLIFVASADVCRTGTAMAGVTEPRDDGSEGAAVVE